MIEDLWRRASISPAEWKASLDTFAPVPLTRFLITCPSLTQLAPQMWKNLFSAFPSLDAIVVGYGPVAVGSSDDTICVRSPELHSLKRALHPGEDGSDSPYYVPALRTLQLVHAIVDESMASGILSLTRLRALNGVPLAELAFVDSYCDNALDRDHFRV
ncbi:hypothetical protein BV20DRAFT_537617 [Pilatotrama ljubarskyi]|nr:hypothetical protein BV20DRAFT_537617 [Pilatotrama ljubarskyi]